MSMYLELMKRARANLATAALPDDPPGEGRPGAGGDVAGRAAGVVPPGTRPSLGADRFDGPDASIARRVSARPAALGVALRVEGRQLHCRGPQDWRTPELEALIAAARDDLAALLAPATADDGRYPQVWPPTLVVRDGASAVAICCPHFGETHRHAWSLGWPIAPGTHLCVHRARCPDVQGGMVQLHVAPVGPLATAAPSLRDRMRQPAARPPGSKSTPTMERGVHEGT